MTHIEILEAIAQVYGRPRYLEIGTGDGGCFYRVGRYCSMATTVDVPGNPYGEISDRTEDIVAEGCGSVGYWTTGSDEFFRIYLDNVGDPFDLIFIDGSHWYEQVRRDLTNSLKVLAPLGTIAMHDTWSPTRDEAAQGSDEAWMVAREAELDQGLQTFTLPVRPGLTLLRPNAERFQ